MSSYPSGIAIKAACGGNTVQDTARRARCEALHSALLFQLVAFGNWNKLPAQRYKGGSYDAKMRALNTHRAAFNAAVAWNGPA